MQKTLSQPVSFYGIGLHTGRAVTMTVKPAAANHGIVFKRVDVTNKDNIIPARHANVVDTRLCTVIGNQDGVSVGTIEHVMAAFAGCGIDNALVEVDAPELPIMDGSAREFTERFDQAGIAAQAAPRKALKIKKDIVVTDGAKRASLTPSSLPVYAGTIEFDHAAIGVQTYEMKLVNGNFRHDMADCRTFCMAEDVEAMRKAGLALGGSLHNAIVVDDIGVMNEDGLRCTDEFIRHKLLDAIGDLYLAGGLIIGRYDAVRPGHDLNAKLVAALLADDSAYEIVDLYVDLEEAEKGAYPKKLAEKAVA
jgi:UDP-3-O-[3-hydroxymyristoyl] N-acetylglucosamine deacetylase